MAFLKYKKIDDNSGWRANATFSQILLLKIIPCPKDLPGYGFQLNKLKNGMEIALKPIGIEAIDKILSILWGKHVVYICEKNMWHYS